MTRATASGLLRRSLRALVTEAVGATRAARLEPAELSRLAALYVAAGRDAVHARLGTPVAAADAMAGAKDRLHDARELLARRTTPGMPDVFYARRWQPFRQALEARRGDLEAIPGVLGTTLGFRRTRGVERDEACIVVFVDRKYDDADLVPWSRRRDIAPGDAGTIRPRLPSHLTFRKRRFPIDVVQLGALRPSVRGGDSLGPDPDHATGSYGTVGTLAQTSNGSTVALTAGHVFDGFGGQGMPVAVCCPALKFGQPAPALGTLEDIARIPTDGVDAALIRLARGVIGEWNVGGIPVAGWRSLAWDGDRNLRVFSYGATSGRISGRVEYVGGPLYGIASVILVSMNTDFGDSGAALIDGQGYVLGLLAGRPDSNDVAVFCSISPVLRRLGCNIPFQ